MPDGPDRVRKIIAPSLTLSISLSQSLSSAKGNIIESLVFNLETSGCIGPGIGGATKNR